MTSIALTACSSYRWRNCKLLTPGQQQLATGSFVTHVSKVSADVHNNHGALIFLRSEDLLGSLVSFSGSLRPGNPGMEGFGGGLDSRFKLRNLGFWV